MVGLRLSSLNANGLGNASKRRAIFGLLRDSGGEVFFIQESHCTRERERIWSAEWGGRAFYAHGTSGSRGVAILLSPSSSAVVSEVHRDPEGRFLVLQATLGDWPVTLVNVYAPTADHPDSQVTFLDDLEKLLQDIDSTNLMIGGDFNCCLDVSLDRFSRLDGPDVYAPTSSRASARLKSLMDELSLSDVWRLLHPGVRQFTFKRAAYASRLDLWLISEHLTELVHDSLILPAPLSDHSIVSVSIQTIPTVRGPGIWRFDNSLLLNKDFISTMCTFLENFKFDGSVSSPHVKWDFLKYEIRKRCIEFARQNGSQLKAQISSLTKDIQRLDSNYPSLSPDEEELYRSKKRELADLELLQANKIIFRARANWAQQGERPNKFFLNLEKRRARTNTQALDDEGVLTSDPRKILDLTRAFYANLYSSEPGGLVSLDDLDWQSLDLPRISQAQHDKLERPYSEKELYSALQKLNKGKTPGTDGISVDFYLRFWHWIKAPLLASLHHGLDTGELSNEQKRGVITLIPRKDVDRRRISNWRPISLLNTDNKILTKAMSLRLQPILNDIIHPDQTGFLPKRHIGDNLRTIQDVIDFTRSSGNPGILLALDFRKAFDSIRWDFILRAFREFGFGDRFLDGIGTIFQGIESCTSNAGYTSRYFSPERGVRQGCCVAPYLFLLTVEVLGIQIRQNSLIRGISVGGCEVKLSQFADDLTAFSVDEDSTSALLQTVETFGPISGLRINTDKSQALLLGASPSKTLSDAGIRAASRTKILGIWFAPDRSRHDHYEWNYKEILGKMRSICSNWRNRGLSIKGKVAVINFLVVSLLYCVAAYSDLPPRVPHELKNMIVHFLWNGGSSKIAYTTLIQPIETGGLKLADFLSRIQAARLSQVKSLLQDLDTFSSRYVDYLAGNVGIGPLIHSKLKSLPVRFLSSPFYSEVFNLWLIHHGAPPRSESEIRWEVLWHNKRVSIEGATLRWDSCWLQGIIRIEDIVHPIEGRFLSHTELNEKYNLSLSFLHALQLRQSIPSGWRAKITPSGSPPPAEGILLPVGPGPALDLFDASPQSIYSCLIESLAKNIKSQAKWESELMEPEPPPDWPALYRLPFLTTRETKLQALQYKILHRTLPCRRFLKAIRLFPEDTCAFCTCRDTITHFLYECDNTKTLWIKVSRWLLQAGGPDMLDLPPQDIILGRLPTSGAAPIVNFVSLFTKSFIQRQKLFHNGDLSLMEWLAEFRKKLLTERYICALEGKNARFVKWRRILEYLG